MTDPDQYFMESVAGNKAIINGKHCLYFAGTGYFQLQTNSDIIQGANEASLKFGIGSATSRVLAGTTPLLKNIEEQIASFFGSDDAAFLPSGYLSNMAGLKAMCDLDMFDTILLDNDSHYSLIEAALAVKKTVVQFEHRNVNDLKTKLETASNQNLRPLIATDGLFPVMAKLAPIDRYLDLAEKHSGLIWIDDAHGVGILGENGRGTFEHFGLKSARLYMGATLSKAFGGYGGFIPGDARFISQVKNGSVSTGSSPPMNAAIGAGIKGLSIVKERPEMRAKLWENAQTLKAGLRSIHIMSDDNNLPIVAFKSGNASQMAKIQRELFEDGIFIQYAKYRGAGSDGVLRIVVFSTHTQDQIDQLIEGLKKHVHTTG